MIDFSQAEIQAIKKAIQYLKFRCKEPESILFASSPHINSILGKVLINDDFGDGELKFYESKVSFDSDKLFAISKIRNSALEEDQEISDEEMGLILNQYLYPYQVIG